MSPHQSFSNLSPEQAERYLELMADQALGQLAVEDAAEMRTLTELAGPDAPTDRVLGELLLAIDASEGGAAGQGDMPQALRDRLSKQGRAIVGGAGPIPMPSPSAQTAASKPWLGVALAASLLIVAGTAAYALLQTNRASDAEVRLASLRDQIAENEQVLASAESQVASLEAQLGELSEEARERETRLAEAGRREVQLAQRLADATSDLERAELAIARYEQPEDPAVLAANRIKLLEVPGTVRLAWAPFDLPDNPALQQGVTGDVVWNDELETGYLRFEGLAVNDPKVSQYQVWVIDDRGLEQKVSGGVFNATAMGEVIVPIDPAIDVGRVALFAITIEEPGGTWVPDLERRVVVAPREDT